MKNSKELESIKKDFDNKFPDLANTEVWFWFSSLYLKGISETAKAYGGCTKCYGKGYSTERVGKTRVMADFVGDKTYVSAPEHIEYHPCTCERGKQFEKILKELSTK
jgi:hypothetical protein